MATPVETEIIRTGFGSTVVNTALHFVVETPGRHGVGYTVHVFHGAPACSDWWKSGFGIVKRCDTMDQAKELIDTLCNRIGAYLYFDVVSRDGYRNRMIKLEDPGLRGKTFFGFTVVKATDSESILKAVDIARVTGSTGGKYEELIGDRYPIKFAEVKKAA